MYQVVEAQRDFLMSITEQWKVKKTSLISACMHAFMISYLLWTFDRSGISLARLSSPTFDSRLWLSRLMMMMMMLRRRSRSEARILMMMLLMMSRASILIFMLFSY